MGPYGRSGSREQAVGIDQVATDGAPTTGCSGRRTAAAEPERYRPFLFGFAAATSGAVIFS